MQDVRHLQAIDTMLGFPRPASEHYTPPSVRAEHGGVTHVADYMFTDVPDDVAPDDPVVEALGAMDANGVAVALVSLTEAPAAEAGRRFPDRFVLSTHVDPNDVMGSVRKIKADHAQHGTVAVTMFPSGTQPAVPADDPKAYAIYSTCVEIGLPIFVPMGVPGPRAPMSSQAVERVDRVCYDFPDLTFVMRHGGEPWEALAVKLLLKWPNLYYSTSAFSPKHYPKAILDYANTRGADKVIYGGYYPYALTLDRIFDELALVPLKDDVMPKFLRGNAARVLGLGSA